VLEDDMADPDRHFPEPSPSPDWMSRSISPGLVVGCVGLVFVIIGAFVSWRSLSFVMHTKTSIAHVTGEVSELDTSGSRSRTVYYPILDFVDAGGFTHQLRGDVSSTSPWRIGASATVRYDPRDPDQARMAGVWDVLPHLFLLLGLAAVVLAIKLSLQKDEP
jgi:hypothetical protein